MILFNALQTCPCWGGGMGSWGMGGTGMGGWGVLWSLLWLLVFAAIVVGAVYLVTRWNDQGGPDRAMELLREQYATGEITYEEFDERAARLRER